MTSSSARTASLLHLVGLPVVVAATLCGCGGPLELSNFRLDGQAPDSPLVLLLSVDFRSEQRTLGTGVLETFIEGRPTSAGRLPMPPLFLQAGLALDAPEGTLPFVLELSLGDNPPPSGSVFRLGVRATDAGSEESPPNSSATQEIRVRIAYDDLEPPAG
jgi:hypothetical protein